MSKYSLWLWLGITLVALACQGQKTARFSIHTPEGPVSVLDFRGHFVEIIGDTIFLEENNRFSIGFLKSENSFGVVLSGSPISTVRKDAEDKFLRDLGISEEDACKLKVTVHVPSSIGVNDDERNGGLSFCPNKVARQ